LPGNALSRLEARLSELAGAEVTLERPNDPEHGDFATNVALRLAPVRRQPPREVAAELAEAA
jgi:arginyl-tRNA synthetase